MAGQGVTYQLPWVAAPLPVEPSEEEKARKAEIKERNRERLKEMAAAKKAARVRATGDRKSVLNTLLVLRLHPINIGILRSHVIQRIHSVVRF